MSRGSGYLASDVLKTSTANQELVPPKEPLWTQGYRILKLSFDNAEQDCTVIINGKTRSFLKVGQGFEMGYDDVPIFSFVIVESGIKYNYIGIY